VVLRRGWPIAALCADQDQEQPGDRDCDEDGECDRPDLGCPA
jgi:hypothetical protein